MRTLSERDFKKFKWKAAIEQLRFWVDSSVNHVETRDLFSSGTDFFYDMFRFFSDKRQLTSPQKLAKAVLEHK